MVTDLPTRLRAGEMIRAEILTRTRQELPHATAVVVEGFEETPALVRIDATIWVERDTQKGIVIGDQGRLIKEIGSAARRRLEEMVGRKVHLALWVKVRDRWRDEPALLRQLGITTHA
jgi:GTP-binding protein Era